MNILKKLIKNESGATAIEYGLIAALISIAILIILGQVGTSLNTTFEKVDKGLNLQGG